MGFHASVNTFKLPELQPACHTGPALVLVPISPVSPPGPREEKKKKSLFWFKCDKQWLTGLKKKLLNNKGEKSL